MSQYPLHSTPQSRLRRLALLLAGAVSCSESTAPPSSCDGPITVNVALTTSVKFGWSPACGVTNLTVTMVAATSADERAIWGFHVPEATPTGPAISYGVSPAHATVWQGPEALEVGETYRVTVMVLVGGDVEVANGSATFTWFPPD
jgi:hypothetical protein